MGELRLNSIEKVYEGSEDGDGIVAVEDLSVEIDEGEFLVLVGPSGCGKSTTLRCIAGLEDVTGGEILLNGRPITDRKPKDRGIAMVFQNYALYPHMTARENMSFGLKMTTDLETAEIEERVEHTAKMMGIQNLLNQKPRELSGGQQQRVALGRAIVREPEVFLLDEPLSNLDAKLRTTMRTELQNLQHNLDVTTIYVTHDQTEAMTMGDRIAVLNDGELQQIGTPLECYHEPANQFVAGFIGSPSMNFLSVEVERGAGGTVLVHETFRYPLSDDLAAQIDASLDRLALGIRPENIVPADSDDPRAIPTTVSVSEPLGDMTHVYFQLGDETFTASVAGGLKIAPDDQIFVMFPEEHVHFFDPSTGDAIVERSVTEQEIEQFVDYGTGAT